MSRSMRGNSLPDNRTIARSLAVSALVPASAALFVSPLLVIPVFVWGFVVAALLGLPIYLLLWRFSMANAWTAALAGLLVVGGIYAYNFWPLRYSELETTSWHSQGGEIVYTMINGVPTGEAWNGYYAGCVGFSVAGAIAGWMFWYSISRPGRPKEPRNDDWKYTP